MRKIKYKMIKTPHVQDFLYILKLSARINTVFGKSPYRAFVNRHFYG